MHALNPNNLNGGGSGLGQLTSDKVGKQVTVETPTVEKGHGNVPAPNPKHGGKPGYLS